jgi:outer membrane receptor for ferrienterochelin and colicins
MQARATHKPLRLRQLTFLIAAAWALNAQAQEAASNAPTAPTTPSEESNSTTPKPDAKAAQQPRIDVTGQRGAVDERRNSTAAKIIITREDIEQYGDTNLGDVMRRLPGVTQGGAPGRGGAPRMRGMGGGYTQILLNGERSPPGFSIETISPDQVERIEILRAPTAETGARAIAGTINIILREPLRTQSDEVKAGVQTERRRLSPNLSWTHNDALSETGTYNFTLSLNRNDTLTDTHTSTVNTDLASGAPTLQREEQSRAGNQRDSVFLSSRFQWRLGQGEQFSLQPFFLHNENKTRTSSDLTQSIIAAPYANSTTDAQTNYDVARLNTQLTKRLDAQTRIELRAGVGKFSLSNDSILTQSGGASPSNENAAQRVSDKSWSLSSKLSRNLESGHSLVGGVELENAVRDDTTQTLLQTATPTAPQIETINASTRRTAAYIQDEWDLATNWSANLGLRWESIKTQSDGSSVSVSNESRVLTPIGHLVWRFASPRKDQLRLSLTESYKPPTLQNLASPLVRNRLYLIDAPNNSTNPDRAGNPALKPESAKGVDLAYERFLNTGGIVSVNLFQRNITDYIRNVTALEPVAGKTYQRWVTRPQNISDAITRGIEFDAKFRLTEIAEGAPAVNVRANLSLYRSNVKDVPGPYNHIDQQPSASGNLGADYKIPSTPITAGINYALTPAYTTQVSDIQSQFIGIKRVVDVYAQWAVTPTSKLRFGLANVAALDSVSVNSLITDTELQTSRSVARTDVVASIRLEMRL